MENNFVFNNYKASTLQRTGNAYDRGTEPKYQDTLKDAVSIRLLVQCNAPSRRQTLCFLTWRVGKNGQRIIRLHNNQTHTLEATTHSWLDMELDPYRADDIMAVKEYILGKLDKAERANMEMTASELVLKKHGNDIRCSFDWINYTLELFVQLGIFTDARRIRTILGDIQSGF